MIQNDAFCANSLGLLDAKRMTLDRHINMNLRKFLLRHKTVYVKAGNFEAFQKKRRVYFPQGSIRIMFTSYEGGTAAPKRCFSKFARIENQ